LLPPTARSMRRLARIGARSDDMLIIRGVNVFPSQIEELILRQSLLSGHYQLVVTRPGNMDELAVHVEANSTLTDDIAVSESRVLANTIKTLIGVSAVVQVGAPGSIERSQGKAKRVIDQRMR
jgi:phenylacetate-CoA ligase